MKKKSKVLTLLMLIVALVLAACSGGSNEGSDSGGKKGKKEGKDITIAVSSTFTGMDPHDTNDTLSNSIQKTMMEGLLGFDEEMNVIPVLAKEYSANDEATEFTFILHEDVKFHDGTPFNAEAVKVNFDRLADESNGLKRTSLYNVIDTVEVVGEYEVKFTLHESFGAMINTFAHPAGMIHSPKALEEYGKEVSKNPVGTGPFKFVEWKPGESLTVEKFEDYRIPDQPKVDKLIFKPVTENGSRIAMLQTGEADFIYPVPTEQAKSIDGKNDIEVVNEPSIVVRYMAVNNLKEPFNDVKVRQALNYAIDKEAFISVVTNGYSDVMDSIIPENLQYYSKQDPYPYDVEKAKELLAEAGYADGFKTTLWGANSSSAMKAMEFLQQQLAKVDVQVEVVSMESGTLSDKIWSVQTPEDAEVDMYYAGWSSSTGDADWGIRPLLGGKEAFPPYSFNVSYYDNPKVNELIQGGLNTADDAKRAEVYAEAQKILWDEAAWVSLTADQTIYGKKNYLEGIYLLPDGSLSVSNIEIVE